MDGFSYADAESGSEKSELDATTAYEARALAEDMRIGGVSLGSVIPSRFPETGATQTQSTDYRLLDAMFEAVDLRDEDVLLDVGCGEGRVLSYLYLRGFHGRIIGIELDPEVAQTARSRLEGLERVEVITNNVFDRPDLIAHATALFAFNPFYGNTTLDFIELVEKVKTEPVRFYYCGDYYHAFLDERAGWTRLASDEVRRAGAEPLSYSIYEYAPARSA